MFGGGAKQMGLTKKKFQPNPNVFIAREKSFLKRLGTLDQYGTALQKKNKWGSLRNI